MSKFGYGDTGGYVNRDTSIDRAVEEASSGVLSARLNAIVRILSDSGVQGMTWKEVADRLGLHHGQASGALSNLHKNGQVVMLKSMRNKCHPYVVAGLVDSFEENEYWQKPVRTKSTEKIELADALVEALKAYFLGVEDDSRLDDPDLQEVRKACRAYMNAG
jgi:hypothetical protein